MMKRNYREVKNNPALGYISQISDTSEEEKKEATEPQSLEAVLQEASSIEITPKPEGYKIKPQYSEVKTRRVQLIFPPSLFRKAQARARLLNLSLNEFICLVLDAIVHDDTDPEG